MQINPWVTQPLLLSTLLLCALLYCHFSMATDDNTEETTNAIGALNNSTDKAVVETTNNTTDNTTDNATEKTANSSVQKVTHIVIPNESANAISDANFYPENLLQLALKKTELTDGRATISYFNGPFGRERLRSLLRQGEDIDVLWSSSTPERDLDLLPIKFNIMRGLNEYRVLLIRTEDKEKFDSITTLDELRQFKAGTGIHWSDTLILKTNNMPYTTSLSYEPLFKMLAAKRFDYMARGMQEIKHELVAHANLNLTVADKIMLHYHQPIYFYVSRNNPKLADRIRRGLEIAENDGTFERLFFSVPEHYDASEAIKKNTRLIFTLKSPE